MISEDKQQMFDDFVHGKLKCYVCTYVCRVQEESKDMIETPHGYRHVDCKPQDEGLPMDDQQQQANIDIKELADWMGVSEDEARAIEQERLGDSEPDHKESQSPFVTEDDEIVIPAHVENGEIVDEQTIKRK